MMLRHLRPLWESTKLAWSTLAKNPTRTLLTTLGVTIGIAAVVVVVALSSGAREAVSKQIAAMGSNALLVFPESGKVSGARDPRSGSRLSETDAKILVSEGNSIARAAPFVRANAHAIAGAANAETSAIGTTTAYLDIRAWKLQDGRVWTAAEENSGARVVLLGTQTAKDLFGHDDPVGQRIRIGRHPFLVVGLLEEKGQSPFGRSQDEAVLMPIATARSRILGNRRKEVHGLLFSATSAETTERAKKQATEILRQAHRLVADEPDDFSVRSQAEFQAMQDAIYGSLTILLIGVAGISLVVGGVGIMNIMLVSVTQRMREVGLRMALGAARSEILIQFLVEAIALSLAGGVAGATIGSLVIATLSWTLGWPMTLSGVSFGVAFGLSAVLGIAFGYFPARAASRLEPVVALGRE